MRNPSGEQMQKNLPTTQNTNPGVNIFSKIAKFKRLSPKYLNTSQEYTEFSVV